RAGAPAARDRFPRVRFDWLGTLRFVGSLSGSTANEKGRRYSERKSLWATRWPATEARPTAAGTAEARTGWPTRWPTGRTRRTRRPALKRHKAKVKFRARLRSGLFLVAKGRSC